MLSFALDTYEAVKSLQEAGADESLAKAIVTTFKEGLDEHGATKSDLNALAQSIEALAQTTKADIEGLSQHKKQMEDVTAEKTKINTEYNTLQSQRAALQSDTDPRLNPSGESFDGENYQRTEAQIKQIEAKMHPLYNRWTELSNHVKAIIDQAVATVTNVLDKMNSEVGGVR